MATVSVATYSTVDGASVESFVEVEVTPEVASVLADRGTYLKEKTFTDLSARSDERAGLDPDHLADSDIRRQNNRPMPQGNPWEGPRLYFSLLLGSSRADWHGEDIRDEQGRCGLCHDAELGMGVYCLNCQRCGLEHMIEAKPKTVREVMLNSVFRGEKLKGGTGTKPRKATTKKAKKKAAKKAKAAAKKKAAKVPVKKAQATPKFGRWGKAVE